MTVAMLRVKNEARWIQEVLAAALKVCERAYVLDDHSDDGTPQVCCTFGKRVRLYHSPFESLDETRDKNWLLSMVRSAGEAEWILSIDGDELLLNPEILRDEISSNASCCFTLRVLYLWNRRDLVRTDGVYGRFWRPSLFRLRPGDQFRGTRNGGNFHCGNVPAGHNIARHSRAQLLHFGYMFESDRQRKYAWYNQCDPNNSVEDGYRHMVQGDPGGPDPTHRLRHAGPLSLVPLEAFK